MPPEPFLVLERLRKRFGDVAVIREVSLTVAEGEVLALLGPSGSGKTTLLRLLAGFETPDAGSIRVAGSDVAHLPPARRRFGMVFQHYALFPHLKVGENVAFGLADVGRGRERAAVAERVAEMLRLVHLEGFEGRKVGEISGGQQQRVALARALAPRPRLLLLDEPLSNLDPGLRERTRRALKRTVGEVGITTVLVTHEQEEAFDLAERVAVLHDGAVEQIGTPEDLYASPQTRFVAEFVGRASGVPGTLAETDDGGRGARLAGPEGPVWPGEVVAGPGGHPLEPGGPVDLVTRPEHLRLVEPGAPRAVPGHVLNRRFTGVLTYVTVRLALPGDPEVEVLLEPAAPAREGDAVAVAPRDGAAPRVFGGTASS
ncbi:MAG: ABC transporter ATP-binding protein [Thermoanaerobaculia bacterium]